MRQMINTHSLMKYDHQALWVLNHPRSAW